MQRTHFIRHLRAIRLTPNYLFLAALYGISTLILPFAVQVLVNNLALANLWTSTIAFLTVIGVTLAAALIVKFLQLIVVEFMQRHIFFRQVAKWQRKTPDEEIDSPYFFEIFAMMKTFATLLTEGADLLLRIIFGGIALVFLHPAFLIILILLWLAFGVMRLQGRGGINSSVQESNSKYRLYYEIERRHWAKNSILVSDFLAKREFHFGFIRRQAMTAFATYAVLQTLQLALGIYLFQANQLSIGNLVSSEIILSGILFSFSSAPKLIESFYDFETSCIKIVSVREDNYE